MKTFTTLLILFTVSASLFLTILPQQAKAGSGIAPDKIENTVATVLQPETMDGDLDTTDGEPATIAGFHKREVGGKMIVRDERNNEHIGEMQDFFNYDEDFRPTFVAMYDAVNALDSETYSDDTKREALVHLMNLMYGEPEDELAPSNEVKSLMSGTLATWYNKAKTLGKKAEQKIQEAVDSAVNSLLSTDDLDDEVQESEDRLEESEDRLEESEQALAEAKARFEQSVIDLQNANEDWNETRDALIQTAKDYMKAGGNPADLSDWEETSKTFNITPDDLAD